MALTAIIGGTGLTSLEGLEVYASRTLTTRWGELSAPLLEGEYCGREVVFLPRHGEHYSLPPHRINYRANIQALKDIGVSAVLAVNAVGGISTPMANGVLCIPDQIIDYTWGRESTFFSDAMEHPVFADLSEPYDHDLRAALRGGAEAADIKVVWGGTYGCTQGPRLETAAEIRRLEQDGCTIVGMTAMPEAALARELKIDYASLALVVNKAAGKTTQVITMEQIAQQLATGMESVRQVLGNTLKQL